MLNIISRSIVSNHNRGPRKVVANLMKGLDEIGYPYVINASLNATDILWIHDDKAALEAALKLPETPSIIAGPNIYTLPSEIPTSVLEKNILFIHPAEWVQQFWDTFSETKINSVVWPVGIDTKVFAPTNSIEKELVLIYNKQRPQEDIDLVSGALKACGENYEVLTYGNYKESKYLELLKRSKAIIWVGRSESQGIGLLEAMAMNVPVFVWDITKLGDFVGSEKSTFTQEQLSFQKATTIPYFNAKCGQRFIGKDKLVDSINDFINNLAQYSPREYVQNKLSLKKQAIDFIEIIKNNHKITEESLRKTNLKNNKSWKNGTKTFKVFTYFKDAVRSIIG